MIAKMNKTKISAKILKRETLESGIGFWWPSWILLKKLKNAKKNYRENFLGPICILEIFRNNPSRGVWLYYQILIMAKISKTEISAKIMKRKKIKVYIIRITQLHKQ